MNFCQTCGAQLVAGGGFCTSCGTPVEASTGPQPTAAAAPAYQQPAYPPQQIAYPPQQFAGGYPQQPYHPYPQYQQQQQPAYYGGPMGGGGGGGLVALGVITLILLAVHFYFLRYWSDEYHFLKDYDFSGHRNANVTFYFLEWAAYVAAVLLALIAVLRARVGGRGLWIAALVAAVLGPVFEVAIDHNFHSGVGGSLRSVLGLRSVAFRSWEQYLALAGTIAIVLCVVMVAISRRRTPPPAFGGYAAMPAQSAPVQTPPVQTPPADTAQVEIPPAETPPA